MALVLAGLAARAVAATATPALGGPVDTFVLSGMAPGSAPNLYVSLHGPHGTRCQHVHAALYVNPPQTAAGVVTVRLGPRARGHGAHRPVLAHGHVLKRWCPGTYTARLTVSLQEFSPESWDLGVTSFKVKP